MVKYLYYTYNLPIHINSVASRDLNYFLEKEKCIPMRKIKKHFRDVNFCSESWIKAVKRTQADNVKILAAAVEDFFKPSDFSVTFDILSPLEIAAHHGCLTFFKKITQQNEKTSILDYDGYQHLLFIAIKQGNLKIVKYLVSDCKFNVECKSMITYNAHQTKYLVSPLWCAAVSGKLEVVKFLVEFGANVNSESDTGSTLVGSACYLSHLDIVKFLVNNGGDIHSHNPNSFGTPLINSVQSVVLCEFLLQSGANVNAQDRMGSTALHYAVQEKQLETTKLLLKYGADPFLGTEWGLDTLKIASVYGASEIFEWLVDHVPYTPKRVKEARKKLKDSLNTMAK